MISVLILTRNEQRDLPGCLATVSWSDDIHVFDSRSTDNTVEIAKAGRRHCPHPRLRRLRHPPQRRSRPPFPSNTPGSSSSTPTSAPRPNSPARCSSSPSPLLTETAAFRLRRRDFLFDTWLKHAQISPFYIRLVRPERSHYTRAINEVLEVDGLVADLSYPLDHYPFSKGIAHWIAKHNLYSTMEAELIATTSRACKIPRSAPLSATLTSTPAACIRRPSSTAFRAA